MWESRLRSASVFRVLAEEEVKQRWYVSGLYGELWGCLEEGWGGVVWGVLRGWFVVGVLVWVLDCGCGGGGFWGFVWFVGGVVVLWGVEVAASEFSHLYSLSHRPVSVKPDISKLDISKASSAGGKLRILKPSCERNGITPTPKESLSPTSGSKIDSEGISLLMDAKRLMANYGVNVLLIKNVMDAKETNGEL
ncbi:hypothetical protein Tco_0464286 [Tanacetum coccineum]